MGVWVWVVGVVWRLGVRSASESSRRASAAVAIRLVQASASVIVCLYWLLMRICTVVLAFRHTWPLQRRPALAATSCPQQRGPLAAPAYVSIRRHASAYVGIRQHTSAHVSTRQQTSAHVSIRQHTSAYVSIRQHTSGYVSREGCPPHLFQPHHPLLCLHPLPLRNQKLPPRPYLQTHARTHTHKHTFIHN